MVLKLWASATNNDLLAGTTEHNNETLSKD